MMLYADTVVRVRAPLGDDGYGNPTSQRDWSRATRTVISGVSFQPDTSTETADGTRDTVITGYRLITPKGRDIDLLATDRIEVDGMTLEVDGAVGRYKVGGRVHHVEARLREVTG